MTAFDTVTATISPALSTYIRCKGKVWKNAFISSLQKIAGVEYSVYKKKGSWQIRGDWDNIKQAHKILMKVTTADDWLCYSMPDPAPGNVPNGTKTGEPNLESAKNAEPQESLDKPAVSGNRKSLRSKTKAQVFNEDVFENEETTLVDSEAGTKEKIQETRSDQRVENIKLEEPPEQDVVKEESEVSEKSLNGVDDAADTKDQTEHSPLNLPVKKETKASAKSKEQPVNRRKRGRPRKVQTSMSYAELSDQEGKVEKPRKSIRKAKEIPKDEDKCDSQVQDLMALDDSDYDIDGNDSDSSEGDVTIDKMIKDGKDKIKSMKKFYSCDTCEFKCKSKTSLDEHKQRLHGSHTFKCPICDKVYGVKRDLKKHIRRHTSQFKCERCGKTYKEQRNYRQHLKTHDVDYIPPFFACEQCDKSFTTKYVLQSHVDQVHNGNVPEWLCNVCGKKFKQKHSLQEHHLIHTGERPFTCKICNKSFRHKGSLVNHELLHTDVRLYTCEVCGKDFKHRNSLRIHAVVHSKFRNFECPVCSKRFTQKQALNRHSRIHSGEKPFMCELCGDRFNDNSILRRHMMGIHKTELKSGKQHFVLPAEHYSRKAEEVEEKQGAGSDVIPDVPSAPVQDSEGAAEEMRVGHLEEAPTRLPSRMALPDYNPGNETPPSLRVFATQPQPQSQPQPQPQPPPPPPPHHMFQGFHPDPMLQQAPPGGGVSGGGGGVPVGQFPLSTTAMAAALQVTSPMTSIGQFSDHHNNVSDHPIPLTTSSTHYSELQPADQTKTLLPSMQFNRLY